MAIRNAQLRQQGRQARRQLPAAYRRLATRRLNQRLFQRLRKYHRIALYLHFDGEPDLLPCITRLARSQHKIYLPVITKNQLSFVSLRALRNARLNRFGIIEPSHHAERISTRRLHAIAMPLSAYDASGNRLGMGAGYYDRALAWTRNRAVKPQLIGCAWQCQAVAGITAEAWDIPLDALCNEQETVNFRKRK